MSKSVHKRIKRLIEETNEAYDICSSDGHINADYPEFAGLSISEFKSILEDPDLTRRQLIRMLRKGSTRHKDVNPKGCWSTFLANYVNNVSNANVGQSAPMAKKHLEHKQKP